MKMNRVVRLCGAVACLLAMNILASAGDRPPMGILSMRLRELGRRLDCYFTVEGAGLGGRVHSELINAPVYTDTDGVRDIDGLMRFLTNEVRIIQRGPNITNEIHLVADKIERGKAIIRIRDARLSNVSDYALTNKMSIKYDGNPGGLLELLSTRNELVQPQSGGDLAFLMVPDGSTPIKVGVTNGCVRDILTDCIPLAGYGRVIWSSTTDGKDHAPTVMIKFHGRSNQ